MMQDITAAQLLEATLAANGGNQITPRQAQGILAMSRALSAYGNIGGYETFNFGANAIGGQPPCGEGMVQAAGKSGNSACFVAFSDGPTGMNTFLGFLNQSDGITESLLTGDVAKFVLAIWQDPIFGPVAKFFYGDDQKGLDAFSTWLLIGLVELCKNIMHTPDWFVNGKRADQYLAEKTSGSGGTDQPSGGSGGGGGGGSSSGGGGSSSDDKSEGTKWGGWAIAGAVLLGVGYLGYREYKKAEK